MAGEVQIEQVNEILKEITRAREREKKIKKNRSEKKMKEKKEEKRTWPWRQEDQMLSFANVYVLPNEKSMLQILQSLELRAYRFLACIEITTTTRKIANIVSGASGFLVSLDFQNISFPSAFLSLSVAVQFIRKWSIFRFECWRADFYICHDRHCILLNGIVGCRIKIMRKIVDALDKNFTESVCDCSEFDCVFDCATVSSATAPANALDNTFKWVTYTHTNNFVTACNQRNK